MIRVVISRGEEDLLVKLPLSATAFQLKTRWAQRYSVDVQELLLSTTDGGDLDDTCRIEEIAEDAGRILHLTIQEAVTVDFSVIGTNKAVVHLPIFLSAPPSTQIPKIKEKLAIVDSRPIRLWLDGAPLDSSLSFERQHVARGSKLEVEFGVRVRVKSEGTRDGELEPICCFREDLVGPTLTSGVEGNFHFFHEEKRLNFGDSIGDAFASPESQIDYTVELRVPRKIFVMDSNGVREVSVFTSTTVGELGLECSSALMCDAEVMSSGRKLAEGAGNTLLLADLCVVVVLSHEEPRKRRRCIVRLPGRATVYDLWSKVMKIEETRRINLYFRGRQLNDFFLELRDLGIGSGSSVFCHKEPPLCVKMRTSCGKDATLSVPEAQSVTYSDLMRFHKAQDDREELSWAFLKGLSFKCNGCERLISRKLDGRQLVPAPCCDVASLDLTTVHHSADTGVQTLDSKGQRPVAPGIELESKDVRDRSVMARPMSIVRFRILEPNGKNYFQNTKLFPSDSFSDLLEKLANDAIVIAKDSSCIYQHGLGAVEDGKMRYFTISAELRHNVKEKEEWKMVCAYPDGFEETDYIEKLIMTTHTFFKECDSIFFSPGLVPIIYINLRCVFFELDDSFNMNPRNSEALSDPQCVAYIKCLRFTDTRGNVPDELVLGSNSDGFVNLNSGKVFGDRAKAMRASRIPSRNLRDEYCFILLHHTSRLPKWPIPRGFEPWIFIRDGCDFSIQGGRIQMMKNTTSPLLSNRWILPESVPGVRVPNNSKPHVLAKDIVECISL